MSEKEVKNRWFVINRCKFNIDKAMDYKDYTVALYVSVNDISRPDNEDGTIDIIFKAKATGEMIVKDEFEKIVVKADKSSQSYKLRGQVVQDLDIPDNYTPVDWYNWFMDKLRHYYPEVKAYIKKLEEEK